jgi:phage-related protein
MPYTISQWSDSVQRKEIEGLPLDASNAVLVMLRTMRRDGPKPSGYKIKPLAKRLHGLSQANLKVNKEQIRVLFSVYGQRIVVLHVFKKTSPQAEQRAYQLALDRKKTVENVLQESADGLTTIH